jgi:murein DD-endopeptidase MepM/ murein hydrolase activator NlpD
VYAGPLGIYGQTVVLDHGLGLFTVYGHLRAIDVTVGALVSRGDEIGKTGETGLAGGDHLHFSTAIHGVHVDPVQWWDGRWIRDHVLARLEGHATAPAS